MVMVVFIRLSCYHNSKWSTSRIQ